MNGALTGAVLALLWGTVLIRLPTLWRDPQQRAIWGTLFTLASAKTIATPGVNGLLHDVTSQPQVIPHLLGVAAAFFLLRFISLVTDYDSSRPRAVRYQLLLGVAVIAALLTFAAIAPGGIKTKGTELMRTSTAPSVLTYWVVLNGYLGTVLAIAGALFWRVSRAAPAGLLRNGLRAITAGTLMIAGYAMLKTALIVAHALGVHVPIDSIEPTANGLRAAGTIVAVVGAAVPATGKGRSVVRAYRSLWTLRPLWLAMRRSFPEIILFPRRRALVELAGVDDVQLRLYRRVIEIRDGMLALREYLPAEALDEARTFLRDRVPSQPPTTTGPHSVAGTRPKPATQRDTATQPNTTASSNTPTQPNTATSSNTVRQDPRRQGPEMPLVEACGIALALERHRVNDPAATSGRWSDMSTSLGSDPERVLTEEIAWLSAVSAAFRRDEPRQFAARTRAASRIP